jgi:hypothetical protein
MEYRGLQFSSGLAERVKRFITLCRGFEYVNVKSLFYEKGVGWGAEISV